MFYLLTTDSCIWLFVVSLEIEYEFVIFYIYSFVFFVPLHGVVITAIYLSQIYPCAYALMQRKTEAAYVASLKATNDAVGGRMNPSTAMGDYEKGLHNALRSLHPHIETSGCW